MFTLWFIGRPSAGKSTLASRVEDQLVKMGYPIENIDRDGIPKYLYPDLGFSREDRRTNNRRTAYIAKLLNSNDIPVIVGMIMPFWDSQEQARDIIEDEGDFLLVLVYVKCSVLAAEGHYPKGLYENGREGNMKKFTGINHPLQEPLNPRIIVDTEDQSIDESVDHVLSQLESEGVLEEQLNDDYSFSIAQTEE